jgi:hypothetical protein
MLLAGCSTSQTSTQNNDSTSESISAKELSLGTSDTVDSSNVVNITLDGTTAQCDSSDVTIEDSVVTITSTGIYYLTGTLSDGQIVVDCSKDDEVELVLNNVDISCSTNAPIYVKSANKTVITLETDSNNSISDTRASKSDSDDDEDDTPNGAIYSDDDLTINGDGSLTITANYGNGIATKDNLRVSGGSVTINASNHALKGNDSVTIKDCTLNLTCVGDGIKSKSSDSDDKGYIVIESGDITINSQGDCIKSGGYTNILDGTFNLTSANGHTNASAHSSEFGGGGFGGGGMQMPDMSDIDMSDFDPSDFDMGDFDPSSMEMPTDGSMPDMGNMGGGNFDPNNSDGSTDDSTDGSTDGSMPDMGNMGGGNFDPNNSDSSTDDSTDGSTDGSMPDMGNMGGGNFDPNSSETSTDDTSSDETSSKTISSNGDLTIDSGTFILDSQDDAIHSNGSVTINGGTFTINAGDDGIHADYDCTIYDGNIDIQNSYEGIEGANIYVNGGDIQVVASDDGFNGSDKTSTTTTTSGGGFGGFGNATGYIEFNGGTTYVNASGDGIDSNGDLVFNGGVVTVDGPTSGGDGPLDCGDNRNTITINGGTLIAGGAKQMFETPDDSSTQNSIYCLSVSAKSGNHIALVNSNNNVILDVENAKDMEGIVFSSDKIITGETYTIYTDATISEDGTLTNGTEVGSVEVSSSVSQIGEGSSFGGFGGGGGGDHQSQDKKHKKDSTSDSDDDTKVDINDDNKPDNMDDIKNDNGDDIKADGDGNTTTSVAESNTTASVVESNTTTTIAENN